MVKMATSTPGATSTFQATGWIKERTKKKGQRKCASSVLRKVPECCPIIPPLTTHRPDLSPMVGDVICFKRQEAFVDRIWLVLDWTLHVQHLCKTLRVEVRT